MKSKKFLSLVLAGIMALGICSCDVLSADKTYGPAEIVDETTAQEATETITEAAAETTTAAAQTVERCTSFGVSFRTRTD